MLELRLIFYSILMRQMQADKKETARRTHMARSPWPRTRGQDGVLGGLGIKMGMWIWMGMVAGWAWEIITAMAHKGVALD